VWSLIEDRRKVLQRKLAVKLDNKTRIETQLDERYPEWKLAAVVQRWEEEYQHAMKNVSCCTRLTPTNRFTYGYLLILYLLIRRNIIDVEWMSWLI
jgi:hypothetical protein